MLKIITIIGIGLAFTSTPAQAQHPCPPLAEVYEKFNNEFGEQEVFAADIMGGMNTLHVLISPDLSTWTLVDGRLNGSGCILLQGTNWKVVTPKVPEGSS